MTPVLRSLHWLPVLKRRRTSHSTAQWHPTLTADTYDLPTRASSSSQGRGQVTVIAAFLSVDRLCGTACLTICGLQTSRWTRSNWKHFCLTLVHISTFDALANLGHVSVIIIIIWCHVLKHLMFSTRIFCHHFHHFCHHRTFVVNPTGIKA